MFTSLPSTYYDDAVNAIKARRMSKFWADTNTVPKSFWRDQQVFPERTNIPFVEKKGHASINRVIDVTTRYGNGFINSKRGGVLMFGINSRGQAEGIGLDKAERENYKNAIKQVFKEFRPRVEDGYHFEIHFIPVEDPRQISTKNNEKLSAELFVIAIVFRPFFSGNFADKFRLVKTRVDGGEIYVRSTSQGKLHGPLSNAEAQRYTDEQNNYIAAKRASSHQGVDQGAGKFENKGFFDYDELSETQTDSEFDEQEGGEVAKSTHPKNNKKSKQSLSTRLSKLMIWRKKSSDQQ